MQLTHQTLVYALQKSHHRLVLYVSLQIHDQPKLVYQRHVYLYIYVSRNLIFTAIRMPVNMSYLMQHTLDQIHDNDDDREIHSHQLVVAVAF